MRNIEDILSISGLNQVGNTLVGKLILAFGAVSIATAALVSHGIWRAKVDKMILQASDIEKGEDYIAAKSAYERVLVEDSKNSYAIESIQRVMLRRAFKFWEKKDFVRARELYEEVIRDYPKNDYARKTVQSVMLEYAREVEQKGDLVRAKELYGEVHSKYFNYEAFQASQRVAELIRQAGIRKEVDRIYNTLEAQGRYCDAERAYWNIYYRENYNNDYAKAARDRVNRKMNDEKPLGGLFYSLGCFLGVNVDAPNR